MVAGEQEAYSTKLDNQFPENSLIDDYPNGKKLAEIPENSLIDDYPNGKKLAEIFWFFF
ncbi:hypothetical protein IQ229_18735 [Nostoc cf. edaphicum LEGE 07299]|uniref:Uncharacterized protein n=1 Tax=Nostoc cf. edaphicum LEGE 07299 TaxID=2777974 RepID=A0ABR9U2J7_9NOSO|nr:hypothetical protein [Nostoc edaphicum]MBE9106888.1 hypothetical protein [Nostoc cf. edaphicum LEGE 07299]